MTESLGTLIVTGDSRGIGAAVHGLLTIFFFGLINPNLDQ